MHAFRQPDDSCAYVYPPVAYNIHVRFWLNDRPGQDNPRGHCSYSLTPLSPAQRCQSVRFCVAGGSREFCGIAFHANRRGAAPLMLLSVGDCFCEACERQMITCELHSSPPSSDSVSFARSSAETSAQSTISSTAERSQPSVSSCPPVT